jgi:hypothetical protein
MTPPTQPPSFRVTLVSPTFADAHDPRCLHCGAALKWDDAQHDRAGDYLTCPACQAQYRPVGGQFHNLGEWRPERWCGWCQEWRPAGSMRAPAQGCVVCGHDFDDPTDPPEVALMPPRESRALAHEVLALLDRHGVLEHLVDHPKLREEFERWIVRFRAQRDLGPRAEGETHGRGE